MQLAGELAKMNLASLLRLVRNGELTGRITITHGANSATLYFETGRILHVESDYGTGREALLEIFLWQNGSFAYFEESVANVPTSLAKDEPLERLLRDGSAYHDAMKYLEQLRINSRTIFRSTDAASADPMLSAMNGKSTLANIVQTLGIPRSEYVVRLKQLVAAGKALVVEAPPGKDRIQLPDWVISRLKQDNPDVSQSIVQLVIWADRVKCWLYQADVDMQRVITALENPSVSSSAQEPYSEMNAEYFAPQEDALDQEIASNMSTYETSKTAPGASQTVQSDTGLGPPSPPKYEF